MIHYMKRAYFTRVFDNIGFKCKIICHLKISAFAGITTLIIIQKLRVLNELNELQSIFLPDKMASLPLPIDLSFLKDSADQ